MEDGLGHQIEGCQVEQGEHWVFDPVGLRPGSNIAGRGDKM